MIYSVDVWVVLEHNIATIIEGSLFEDENLRGARFCLVNAQFLCLFLASTCTWSRLLAIMNRCLNVSNLNERVSHSVATLLGLTL